MVAIGAVLVVVSLSVLATRIGSLALEATGLSSDAARFQAQSMFTGVGFTTSEAESITGDPARRRVASWLMLLGNAGIVSIIASLVLGFSAADPREAAQRIGVLVVGLLLLLVLIRSNRVARFLRRRLEQRLARWTAADIRDYTRLLGITDQYAVQESVVAADDWLAGHRLQELDLPGEGVLVLGVRRRDGSYVGAPGAGTRLQAGDVVLLYGHEDQLVDLGSRPAGDEGDQRRSRSVREHQERRTREEHGG
ncbi:MAG: TrkA C-terminal domain-containing protein [Nitriliruptoraceae bacterium]